MDNLLRKLMDAEDKFLANVMYPELGWESHQLNLTPAEVRKLTNAGFISVVYKSNKHTSYKLNRETIEKYLNSSRELYSLYPQEKGVPNNLFDTIYGYDDIKENVRNFIKRGSRGGFLFIGPPASAKTLFLMEISRLPDSVYITASASTKVGIRDILMDDEPKYLCIDELDKATNRDYDLLLSLTETGIVQKNIHDTSIQRVLGTQVFAAANRGKHIPPEIMSRLITLNIRAYNMDELRQVGEWMLIRREHIPEATAKAIVGLSLAELKISDVRDFVKIARLRSGDDMNSVMDAVNFLKKYS